MKILIYDVDFSSSGNVYPLKSGLEQLGYEADMFDWRKYLYTYNSTSLINRVKDRILFNTVSYKINLDLKRLLNHTKYDIFLIVRGDHIYPDTVNFAKKYVSKVVNWSSDDLFNKKNNTRHIINSFKNFDIHFSPRKHLREEYISKGAKAFETVDWYYRPEMVLKNSKLSKNYKNDIAFIGSWSERRQMLLSSLKDVNFKVYGWGWKKKLDINELPNWNINMPVGMQEMVNIFSTTKINLNILTIENRDRVNPRNFDIAVAKGFQLSERTEEVLELFKEDVDIACFDSPEELKDKYDFYIKKDNLREKMAISSYRKIIGGNNSLVDRLRHIVDKTNL